VTARRLVGPGRATQAIAAMTLGFTVANLVGVPLGTVVAQLAGWRIVLGSISTIGVVCIVGLIAWLPRDAGSRAT
jgi:DHA1 family inner membrane transport protein